MLHWLYRYVFRGIGILMLIGMITMLFVAISSQVRRSHAGPAAAPVHAAP